MAKTEYKKLNSKSKFIVSCFVTGKPVIYYIEEALYIQIAVLCYAKKNRF